MPREVIGEYHTRSGKVGVIIYRDVFRSGPSYSYMGEWGAGSGGSAADMRAHLRVMLDGRRGVKVVLPFGETHMTNSKSKVSDKLNVDEIAKLFGLPEASDLIEGNIDNTGEVGYFARKEALAQGASEEEAEEADIKAQEEAQAELFHQWHDGVMAAAESLFEKHGLTLEPRPVNKTDRYPYEYKVVPEESWEKALAPIIETINGVGYFEFSGVKDFLRSGPYTPREGVLTHLHHIVSYPEVYGDTSAQRIYERSFR